MKNEINKKLENLKLKNQELIDNYNNREQVFDRIGNANFEIKDLYEKNGGILVYTDDFKIIDDYKIITVDRNVDWEDFGPYEKKELKSESYSKGLSFFKKEKFGNFDLEIMLKEDYMMDNKLNILYEYNWSQSGTNFFIPNSLEAMIDFYRLRGMDEKMVAEVSNVIKMTKELIEI